MKRLLCIVLVLTLCITAFSGCAAKKDKHTVELKRENYWKYLEVIMITSFLVPGSEESLECEIHGVLDYAYYEDVELYFTVDYYDADSADIPERGSYEVKVKLNAAGNAAFEVVSNPGLVKTIDGKGACSQDGYAELYRYRRHIHLHDVTGKVIYTV